MSLKIYVTYTAAEGCREQFIREVLRAGIINHSRADKGCLAYNYYLSLDDVNKILLEEEWESSEDQQAHWAAPHMDTLRELKKKYITDTQSQRI